MPQSKRNAKRRSRKRPSLTAERLKEIALYQKTDMQLILPSAPDTPRMYVPRNKVYTLSRVYDAGTVTAATTAAFGVLTTTLNSLPGNAEFSALFAEYRIINVTIDFLPLLTLNTSAANQPLYTVYAPDDAIVPASLDVLRQYDTLAICPAGTRISRTYTPRLDTGVWNGTTVVAGGSSSPFDQWFDTTSNLLTHFGVKWGIPAASVAGSSSWSAQATCIVQFRHPL